MQKNYEDFFCGCFALATVSAMAGAMMIQYHEQTALLFGLSSLAWVATAAGTGVVATAHHYVKELSQKRAVCSRD